MNLRSKLPQIETTIFTVMSQLAQKNDAVNLSQGFPDFDCSPKLVHLVYSFMKKGFNQYAPMSGVQELRERICEKVENLYQSFYHPDTEITISSGGSEAIFSALASVVHAGDEVIIFEPAYDLYRPVIEILGGVVRSVELSAPDFNMNWEEIKKLCSEKTKLILINNPNNPGTYVWTKEDFDELTQLTQNTNIVIISDEVYEHLVFDGLKHLSVCQFPELKNRSFVVVSFGKLFHVTGWKVGYCLAPENLMKEFRKVHQYNVFSVNTPIQYALSEFLAQENEYIKLHKFYQKKRDYFMEGLVQTSFKIIRPKGSYFLLADYSEISDQQDFAFATYLIEKYKVATIPVSAFYKNSHEQKLLRFCFAKKEESLEKALVLLRDI